MPTLILVRHAKAEPPADGPDHNRPLTLAGRSAATQLGEHLAAAGLIPHLALVSSAVRAQQTWQLMTSALGAVETTTLEEIYDTDDEGLHALIKDHGATADCMVVVGHEPTISATAAALSGQGSDTRSLQRVAHGFPTGAAAVLEFDGAWTDLAPRTARLVTMVSADIQY